MEPLRIDHVGIAVNSLDEEGEYAVTPITQEIIDGRAY